MAWDGQHSSIRRSCAVHANELSRHARAVSCFGVVLTGSFDNIRIKRANHNPGVIGRFLVQCDEIPAVEGKNDTPGFARKPGHFPIGHFNVRLSGIDGRPYIAPKPSELDDNGWRKFSLA